MVNLKGKVCLVTGGGSGIGKATALEAARAGARMGVLGRKIATCEQTVAEIHALGGEAIALEADVSQAAPMKAAIDRLAATWGRIDGVFSNAGINGIWAPVEDIEPEQWDATFNINLRGAFLTVKYAIPHLRKQGGAIVIDSSAIGSHVFSNVGSTAYGCSKAALCAFAKLLALELGEYHIRVNAVLPGPIHTNIGSSMETHPALARKEILKHVATSYPPATNGRGGAPIDVANAVVFLLSDAARFINGAELVIDGGNYLVKG